MAMKLVLKMGLFCFLFLVVVPDDVRGQEPSAIEEETKPTEQETESIDGVSVSQDTSASSDTDTEKEVPAEAQIDVPAATEPAAALPKERVYRKEIRIGGGLVVMPQFEKANVKVGPLLAVDMDFNIVPWFSLGFRIGLSGQEGDVDNKYIDDSTDPYISNSSLWYSIWALNVVFNFAPRSLVCPYLKLVPELLLGTEIRYMESDSFTITQRDNLFLGGFHPHGMVGLEFMFGRLTRRSSKFGLCIEGGAGYLILSETMFFNNTYTVEAQVQFVIRF